MFIYDFMNYVLAPFGLSDFVLIPSELFSLFSEATSDKWQMLLRPDVICSSLLYLGVFVAVWEILLVFPFRLVKRLIGYRSRKSVER